MDAFRLLSVSVTPVVLISACGLILLALYNRLGTILARIRAFHQQKIELLGNPGKYHDGDQEIMLKMFDSQISTVTAKARTIQKGLYCLLTAVSAFLICSFLGVATAVLHESLGVVALGMDLVGLCLFLAGIGWAIRELTLSLVPLEEENAYLAILTLHHSAKSQNSQKTRPGRVA